MKILLILLIILRGAAGLGASIAGILFLNHIIGFIFGFSFRSIGEPTLEILGIEILAGGTLAGIHWLLDKLVKKSLRPKAKKMSIEETEWRLEWVNFLKFANESSDEAATKKAWTHLIKKWEPVDFNDKPISSELVTDWFEFKPFHSEWSDGSPIIDMEVCPHGHGKLEKWDGNLRCFKCGWPEKLNAT